MTKIDGDYLVTDDPGVAMLFLGKRVGENPQYTFMLLAREVDGEWKYAVHDAHFPRALVREAIEPVEGEVAICEWECHGDKSGIMLLSADEAADLIFKDETKYNWRLVNICQDYGELRKLVEWARG